MKTVKLNTPCGAIKGIDQGDYDEYRGIRYATADRWEYPVLVKEWKGEYDATKFGACSYQRRGFEEDAECNPFYHKEFRVGQTFEYSEDCLFLNVYAPKNAEKAPVIIYIHGGSFTGGSADEGHINGKDYAKNGVVCVTINYRLGPYGFCSHPDLTNEEGVCGNFGLYDELASIHWVRENIKAFGGNPYNINIMGESAGAMSTDLLISSELTRGLIKGAIMMSGAGIQRQLARPLSPEKTRSFWDMIIENAGVKDIWELKEVDEKTLYYAWLKACDDSKPKDMILTLPVNDGKLVTKENYNMDTIPNIPIILGVTISDMVPAAMEGITRRYAKKANKNSTMGCYVYNFNRLLPGDDKGAWHAADLLYAFNTFSCNWRPFEDIDYKIADQMIKSFCAFARNGNPDCPEIPHWERGGELPMRFCEDTRPAKWETKEMFKTTVTRDGAMY